MSSRRDFIKKSALTTAGVAIGGLGFTAKSYGRIKGANDRVQVAILGFSDRFKSTLGPCFLNHAKELNFEFVSVCDLWSVRREEGLKWVLDKTGQKIKSAVNTEALWNQKPDAIILSTADFSHALLCAEALRAGSDVYCEKPFAETMDDANWALKAAKETHKVIQIGSQRRSGSNYQAAHDYIQSGKFGKIVGVEMTWNVNQPGRWRRPALVNSIREKDTDWKRYLLNRPFEPWDPRKYLEFRLFWPYSSGIPGQWMAHQIDTVNWFSHLEYPRSVAANGGIYLWKDGRKNFDTMTAVFEYGPHNTKEDGFQVIYSSRQVNSAGGIKELYFSNGGTLDLDKNTVTSAGGLTESSAKEMGMKSFLLEEFTLPNIKIETSANTGGDPLTNIHMRNWLECVRNNDPKTHAPVEAGYNHSISCIMSTAALRTGQRVVFDPKTKQVMAGNKVFKY